MTNCAAGRGYADSLDDLGVPPTAAASRSSAPTCRGDGDSKSGYDITYAAIGVQQSSLATCSTITDGVTGLLRVRRRLRRRTPRACVTSAPTRTQTLFEDGDASPVSVAFDVFPARAATNGHGNQVEPDASSKGCLLAGILRSNDFKGTGERQ